MSWSKVRTVIVPIVVAAALTLTVPRADATLLAPGGVVPAAGIAFPGGTELASVSHANIGVAGLVVDVDAAVFRSAEGTLDFYYQVTNDSAANLVHRLTASSFDGFITDVWFVLNGAAVSCATCPGGAFDNGTQDPLNVDRDFVGNVVGFNFPSPGFEVDPGETSVVLLVRTNATNFRPGFVSVINSGATTQTAFEPSSTTPPTDVPEPGSLVLLGLGLLGIGAAMWRKRRA